ncbi:dimethylarginine dimethylaminohydrolase family protein [Clostridium butyricum]|jgi:N-dimethylarginine dimethylaminohydrolase|uniref:dimethylarginine dimethylaminohydrolase family protein n=1 Tax=Clostridium butyricum TaxID=1492 RepID=UPI0034658EC6
MIKFGIDSEYKQIKSVVLSCPKLNYSKIINPYDVMYYKSISYDKLVEEVNLYTKLLNSLNIKVYRTDNFLEFNKNDLYYNMMFSRDLSVITNKGIIISNMKHEVRKSEPEKMMLFFNKINIPILEVIKDEGNLEGADVLWVRGDTVLVGVGNRTNIEGLNQVCGIFESLNVRTIPVQVPKGIQHLLGVLNIISDNTVLMRTDIVSEELYGIIRNLDYNIISIKESEEVTNKQAMNIVTINSKEIIMPNDCPQTEEIYIENGIKVHKTLIRELRKGAGGLGCATLILERSKNE